MAASDIQKLYNTIDAPPSAIRKVNNLMCKLYAYFEREGYCRDFTASLIVPNEKRKKDEDDEIVIWEDEEIRKILGSFDNAQRGFRLRFLIVMAYYTGCRVSELLGMKYSDFDLVNNSVTVQRQIGWQRDLNENEKKKKVPVETSLKTSAAFRTLPIPDEVVEELKLHLEWHKKEMTKKGYKTDLVFCTSTGNCYDKKNIRRALFGYYKAIGIEPTGYDKDGKMIYKPIHTYRHTYATNLVRAGAPIQLVSQLMGHADINMTLKYYVNVGFEDKREAVNKLLTFVKSEVM